MANPSNSGRPSPLYFHKKSAPTAGTADAGSGQGEAPTNGTATVATATAPDKKLQIDGIVIKKEPMDGSKPLRGPPSIPKCK